MATKAVTVKLSEQRQAGVFKCYKRFIGGRVFYLAHDRDESIRMVLALLAKWRELKSSGKGWTPDVVASVLAPFRQRTAKPTTAGRPTSLHKAIDAYLADYKDRVSDSRYQRHATALAAYKGQQSDCSLSSMTWDKLNATIAYFIARPKTSHGSPKTSPRPSRRRPALPKHYDEAPR